MERASNSKASSRYMYYTTIRCIIITQHFFLLHNTYLNWKLKHLELRQGETTKYIKKKISHGVKHDKKIQASTDAET